MQLTSARWDAAIRVSHPIRTRVEVWHAGVFTGQVLEVDSGRVRLDDTSKVLRQLTLSCPSVDLMPSVAEDLLSPLHADLRVSTGLRYAEGDDELVPAGVFRVSSVSRSGLLSALTIEGTDYAGVCAAMRLLKPWNIPAGSLVVAQIIALVRDVLPWVDVVDVTGSQARHPGGVIERDRWDGVQGLADAISAEVFFDASGRLVIRPASTLAATPDWVVNHSARDASLLDVGQSISLDGVFNAVRATSSAGGDAPLSAAAVATTGPLAYRTTLQLPRFFASPVLKTVEACQSAAATILSRSAALARTVAPAVAPNPALEQGDTISVDVPGLGVGSWIVSGYTIGLTVNDLNQGMPLTVRPPVGVGITIEGDLT